MLEFKPQTAQSEQLQIVTAYLEAVTLANALNQCLPGEYQTQGQKLIDGTIRFERDDAGNITAIRLEPSC